MEHSISNQGFEIISPFDLQWLMDHESWTMNHDTYTGVSGPESLKELYGYVWDVQNLPVPKK